MDSVDRIVGAGAVPASVRTLCSLPGVDYADVFTLATSARATPEQWARTMFGDVPGLGATLIWRGLLSLRLAGGRSPDTVAGWRIGEVGEDWIRLEAASWWLSGNLVVLTAESTVTLATLLYYERSVGRVLWPPLSVLHRYLVPDVLHNAAIKMWNRS